MGRPKEYRDELKVLEVLEDGGIKACYNNLFTSDTSIDGIKFWTKRLRHQGEQFTLVKALFTDIETNAYTSGYIVFTKLGVLEPKLEKLQA